QRVHRVAVGRQGIQGRPDRVVQRPVGALVIDGLGQLVRSGQLTVPQQVGHGLEGLGGRQLRNRVAAVEQGVRLGVDLGDGGDVGDDPVQPLADLAGLGVVVHFSLLGSTAMSALNGEVGTSKSKTEVSNLVYPS